MSWDSITSQNLIRFAFYVSTAFYKSVYPISLETILMIFVFGIHTFNKLLTVKRFLVSHNEDNIFFLLCIQFTIKSQVICHPFTCLAGWLATSIRQSSGYVCPKFISISELNVTFSVYLRIDISRIDDSFSRLAGYESSPDGTSLWNRRGFSTHSRYSILDCFFTCQKRIKQYIAKRKVYVPFEEHLTLITEKFCFSV